MVKSVAGLVRVISLPSPCVCVATTVMVVVCSAIDFAVTCDTHVTVIGMTVSLCTNVGVSQVNQHTHIHSHAHSPLTHSLSHLHTLIRLAYSHIIITKKKKIEP